MRILRQQTSGIVGLNQKGGVALLPMVLPFGLSENNLILLTHLYPYRGQILLAIFLLSALLAACRSIAESIGVRRKKEGAGSMRDLRRRIAGRLALLSASGYVLWRLYDLRRIYYFRWPILILLAWFVIAGIAVWIFGRWGKRGMAEAAILYHLIGILILAGFLFKFQEYRPAPPLLIGLVVALNMAVFFRKTIASRLDLKKRGWPVLVCFGAFLFAPAILHPALRIAADPPRFGAVTLVPGTGGMAIEQVAISRTGRMLYFTTRDPERGLGRLELISDRPEFDTYGFSRFKTLVRYPPGNILAAGAESSSGGEILLFRMDPPRQIERFSLPIHSLDKTSIQDMVTTPKYMFASVNSNEGVVLLACPHVDEAMAEDPDFQARCFQMPLEIKKTGTLAASEFVNRVLVGSQTSPLGISDEAVEVLALILKDNGKVDFKTGALATLYGDKNRRLLVGRPFLAGIDLIDSDNMETITTLPGPLAVNTLYNQENLLVGGSYLEGQIVIWNLQTLVFRYVYVGPGVTDIDFNRELNDLFVATDLGVIRVDMDLLFEHPILWG